MTWDIYVFGLKMRAAYLRNSFEWKGKAVLIVLGALQFAGWLLVGAPWAAGT